MKQTWQRLNLKQYKQEATYNENRKNGVNLPDENRSVLICDMRSSITFVGRFSRSSTGNLLVFVQPRGGIYSNVGPHLAWADYDECKL